MYPTFYFKFIYCKVQEISFQDFKILFNSLHTFANLLVTFSLAIFSKKELCDVKVFTGILMLGLSSHID